MRKDQGVQLVRLLTIEDSPDDFIIIKRLLSDQVINNFYNFSFRVDHVDRLSKGIKFIKKDDLDVILLDVELPDGSGMDLVNRIRKKNITVPIIILTSYDYAKVAIEAVRKGAQDYLSKDEITSKNLVRTICYAIERQKLKNKLTKAYNRIKVLHGLLPICCLCMQIRDDKGYWHQLETYMSAHADVNFSHGYCPTCLEKKLKELEKVKPPTERAQ